MTQFIPIKTTHIVDFINDDYINLLHDGDWRMIDIYVNNLANLKYLIHSIQI